MKHLKRFTAGLTVVGGCLLGSLGLIQLISFGFKHPLFDYIVLGLLLSFGIYQLGGVVLGD